MKRVVNPTSRLIWPEVEVDEDQDQEVDHLENSRKVCLRLFICDGWYDLRRWNLDGVSSLSAVNKVDVQCNVRVKNI